MSLALILGAPILTVMLAVFLRGAAKMIGWRSTLEAMLGGISTAALLLLAGWLIAGGLA